MAILFKGLTNCTDAAIHHVTWRDNISTGFGMT